MEVRSGAPESFGWLKRADLGARTYEKPGGEIVVLPTEDQLRFQVRCLAEWMQRNPQYQLKGP